MPTESEAKNFIRLGDLLDEIKKGTVLWKAVKQGMGINANARSVSMFVNHYNSAKSVTVKKGLLNMIRDTTSFDPDLDDN